MPGSYIEGFFKPELDRVMKALIALDDRVRSELTGKQIGTADTPAIAHSAKDLLSQARKNFNRREYISGVSDLGMFHKKMATIIADIEKWKVDVNKIHHKFLFEGVKDDKIQQLRDYMEKRQAQELRNQLIKEAGIMDFFYNLVNKRGRSLAAWEKKYPKETKDLREGGSKLLDVADSLLANTIFYMKEMATARATRRPDDYMDAANKIKGDFDKFDAGDKGFKSYYANAILPFMKIKDQIEKDMAEAEAKAKAQQAASTTPSAPAPGSVRTELGTPPTSSQSTTTAPLPATPGMGGGYVSVGPSPWAAPPPAASTEQLVSEEDIEGPLGEEHPTDKTPPPKHAHFFSSLKTMSNEDPRILSGYISKYAKSIQESDLETAIKLFAIVKRLRG